MARTVVLMAVVVLLRSTGEVDRGRFDKISTITSTLVGGWVGGRRELRI